MSFYLLKIKNDMAQVDVNINNRTYRISCKDGEEDRVESLALLINTQVKSLAKEIGQLGEARMILLAALVLLDKADENENNAIVSLNNVADKLEELANEMQKI
tara:strand:- start:913 stop:1221 length:309 start_codon:yes stop_codon:yes gene_type:complete